MQVGYMIHGVGDTAATHNNQFADHRLVNKKQNLSHSSGHASTSREQLTIDSHAISKNINENQKHQRETESSNIQQLNAESLISKSFCYYHPSSLISMVHMAHDAIEKGMSDEMVQKNLVLEHKKIKLLSFNNEQSHAKDDLLEQHKSWQLQMKCSAEILKTFGITGPCQN
ncbi:hypothetical protein BY996DRAFT_8480441 [Phakopsora pachyrhizi]|nr:hypothetical protein BY996DRAFT_8480441 [Phakopsora pachyrhizi]